VTDFVDGRDVFVVWARCKWDDKVRGFLLEKVGRYAQLRVLGGQLTINWPYFVLPTPAFGSLPCTNNQDTPGLSTTAIKDKVALRVSVTGSIYLDNVHVGLDALLPGSKGLGSAFKCLNSARSVSPVTLNSPSAMELTWCAAPGTASHGA
jgi:glutaryl-CoA dehydrogenase